MWQALCGNAQGRGQDGGGASWDINLSAHQLEAQTFAYWVGSFILFMLCIEWCAGSNNSKMWVQWLILYNKFELKRYHTIQPILFYTWIEDIHSEGSYDLQSPLTLSPVSVPLLIWPNLAVRSQPLRWEQSQGASMCVKSLKVLFCEAPSQVTEFFSLEHCI